MKNILAILLLFSSVALATPEYALKLWTVEDGLPASPVNGIAQDAAGYLWLAAQNHLIRFDGTEFSDHIAADPEWRFTGVFCRDREVWCHGSFGVAVFVEGTWQIPENSAALGAVLGMVSSADGRVCCFAERGLLFGDAKRLHSELCPVPADDRATLGAVTGAAIDNTGNIVMTAWNGLLEWASGKFSDQSMHLPDFLVEAVGGVCSGASGRLWVHGPNGVAFRENDIWTPIGFPSNAGMANTIAETSDGALWMGNAAGLFRWNGEWQSISAEGVPGSVSVNFLFEDFGKTLWAACDGGLLRIRRKLAQTLSNDASSVFSVWRLPDGSVWTGEKGKAVHRDTSGNVLSTIPLGIDVPVSALLFESSADRLWIGTSGAGLFLCERGQLSFVGQSDYSLPQVHTVHCLYKDRDFGLLVGTPQGLMRVDDRRELGVAIIHGTAVRSSVRALCREKGGGVLLCGDEFGLLSLRADGTKLQIGADAGLRGMPRALYRDTRGDIWVGTTRGLFLFRNETLSPVSHLLGNDGRAILQISEDTRGRLWLGTTSGILALAAKDLGTGSESAIPPSIRLGVADGLPGERCLGGVAPEQGLQKGELLFPVQGGVVAVRPEEVDFSERTPSVVLEGVEANDESVHLSDSRILFPAGTRNIRFRFRALAPDRPESIRYRYRLDGEWSTVQKEGTVAFEWLPPGIHSLTVAAEAGGVWNENGAFAEFEIPAFFWQTIPFYVAVALLLASAVLLFTRWILRHRYELQMAVLKREEALYEERARISRDIHDDLGNGLSVVATLSELAQNDVSTENGRRRLDQIYEVANGLARNVDEIVWALNPANEGWEAFVSYFEQYTEYFLANSGIRFRILRPENVPTGCNVAPKARHHLLLAVREAVGNALKHAKASQMKIEMQLIGEDTLRVCVEDDGCGFDTTAAPPAGHDGLGNMARRMKLAGGTLVLSSKTGVGTRIEFSVPFERVK